MLNEPDDWSTLFAATSQMYFITRLKYGALLIISILILFIWKKEDNSRKIVIGKLFLITETINVSSTKEIQLTDQSVWHESVVHKK